MIRILLLVTLTHTRTHFRGHEHCLLKQFLRTAFRSCRYKYNNRGIWKRMWLYEICCSHGSEYAGCYQELFGPVVFQCTWPGTFLRNIIKLTSTLQREAIRSCKSLVISYETAWRQKSTVNTWLGLSSLKKVENFKNVGLEKMLV
jgi:hypothetical protein